jgi:hypothetical protein
MIHPRGDPMRIAAFVGLALVASVAMAAERTVLWEYFTQTG